MNYLQTTEQHKPLTMPQGRLPDEVEDLVNRIFEQLLASCPSIQYWTPKQVATAKRQWVLGFAENGIKTIAQVKQGVRALRAKEDDFVPSIGKFVSWCKAVDLEYLGLPNAETLLKRLNYFSSFGFEGVDDFKFKSDAEYWLITDLYQRNQKYNGGAETLRKQAEQALADMAKQIQSGVPVQPRKVTIQKPKEYVPAHPLVEARIKAMQQAKGAQNGI